MEVKLDTQRRDALAAAIGGPLQRVYTAVPPLHLGGAVDVLCVAGPDGGVTYVTCGLTLPNFPQRYGSARFEIAIHARAANEWAPKLLARLGPASALLRLTAYGALPIGDGVSRLGGLVFSPHEPRGSFEIGGQRHLVLRGIGVTPDELAACRTAGPPSVLAAIERAGVHPYTDPNRATVATIDTLLRAPPCVALEKHLSPGGRRGLQVVLHGMSEEVERAREGLVAADIPVLAVAYLQLPSWPQRSLLVQLTQDHHHPSLQHVWRHALSLPDPEERTEAHSTLAIAVVGLEQDFGAFGRYWNDLPQTLLRARELREQTMT